MLPYKLFAPDRLFASFRDVSADYLAGEGIALLICDIDNTLVTYDDPEPTDDVLDWIRSLQAAGIAVAFVSNNDWQRVSRFNGSLGFFASAKSGKPFPGKIREAMDFYKTGKSSTALLGDQLLTDVWAARNAGITALTVPPINDKTTFFWRFKRRLERPVLKKYLRLHAGGLPDGISLSVWKL